MSEGVLGTIITTEDSPSVTKFSFVIDEKGGGVNRGQFVSCECKEGILVGLVTNIFKTNKYFESAGAVSEYSKSTDLFSSFPVGEWEYSICEVRVLGVFTKNEGVQRVNFPPKPGSDVVEVPLDLLNKFLGLEQEKGLHLGKVSSHNLDAKFSMTKLLQKHLAILSISGGGKSYATSVLIEELLDRDSKYGKIGVLLIDNHSEYLGFLGDSKYSSKVRIIDGRNVRIACKNLHSQVIHSLLPNISAVQARELGRVIEVLRKEGVLEGRAFDLDDLIIKLGSDEGGMNNKKTREALISWVLELKHLGVFDKIENPKIRDVLRAGEMTIIDLGGITSLRKKQLIVDYFSRELFELRRRGLVCPYLEIIEEAHNFCLSEDTEILTTTSWKKYNEIKKGDLVLSYNKETNKLEFNPIERIIIKEHGSELIKLYNQESVDALVTGDHRVLCHVRTTDKTRKWKWSPLRFVLAKNLPSGLKIPVAAEMVSDSKCDIDNDLIKILGWIITDGCLHYYDNRKHFSYEISQARSKGDILKEMKKTIKRRFSESKIYTRKKTGYRFPDPKYSSETEEFTFYLGKRATEEIKNWLGDAPHRIPRQFLQKASLDQLKILFDALVQGDGTIYRSKNKYQRIVFYSGYDSALADDFQELCVRLGLSAVKTKLANDQIIVAVSFKRKFAYVRKIAKEQYYGKVWDITVRNSAFIARRNGKVFITGNCPEGKRAEQAISRHIIETVAREGRKFFANLCLISQRPIHLSTTALSQCNTNIILRITNPYDLKHISETSEHITSDIINIISSLRVGEAIVLGEASGYPVFIKIRRRRSKEKEVNDLEEAAREWELKNNKLADAGEFL